MAMYSAAFDDSGHPDDGEYLVVAGAVADVDQWIHMEREWQPLVNKLGQSVFHRCDVDFSDPKADEVLRDLGRVIRRRVERSFASVVRLHQYHKVNQEFVLSELVGWPYPLATRLCIGETYHWAEYYNVSEPIVICERGAKHQGQIEWIMCRDQLPMPDFRDKNFVPLQAADLIAGEIAAHLPAACDQRSFKPSNCLQEIWPTLRDGWHEIKLDILPTIFSLPKRDPRFRYRSKIVKVRGERRALVHFWPKARGNGPKVKRKLLQIPPQPMLTPEIVEERLALENAPRDALTLFL